MRSQTTHTISTWIPSDFLVKSGRKLMDSYGKNWNHRNHGERFWRHLTLYNSYWKMDHQVLSGHINMRSITLEV